MSKMKWYIKERHNPQLGTYYTGQGQMSKKDAKAYEHPLYGDNVMHVFETETEYLAELYDLRRRGNKVIER